MMYCTPTETRKARKVHQCTNCAELIMPGEIYKRWGSVDDGKMYDNKMHPECLDSFGRGPFEYTPYSGERQKEE